MNPIVWGYITLFAGAFLAATILPFSSEILVTGMLDIKANPIMVGVVATLGNWLGSTTTFGLGWLGKWGWIEKWFKITPDKLEKQQAKVSKYGSFLAFFVWFPLIGDVLALALGFYKVNPPRCILFMLLGKASRFAVYILIFTYARDLLNFKILPFEM